MSDWYKEHNETIHENNLPQVLQREKLIRWEKWHREQTDSYNSNLSRALGI
jgi:hypothetical protein